MPSQIIARAVNLGASDIHFEPEEKLLRIRSRIDGLLRPDVLIPKSLQSAVLSRVKVMAEMDVAENRLPQDGRAGVFVGRREINLRVSSLPTSFGENIVVRILNPSSSVNSIHSLGLSEPDEARLRAAVDRPHGVVVVTGPTGSGKSTTLYAILREVASPEWSVFTLEDPVEFVHPCRRSVIVHREVGDHTQSFAAGLRSAMRSDPDLILLGEMRELETIKLALNAASMGILVFGTLHTNSAPKTVDRIINAFPSEEQNQVRVLLAGCLAGIVSQLLCKKQGGGRVAVHEILLQHEALPNVIRSGRISDIRSIIESGAADGMCGMDSMLMHHLDAGTINAHEAYMKALDKKLFDSRLAAPPTPVLAEAAAS